MPRTDPHKLFYDIIWPHADVVLRMALILTHHRQQEAEDVAQETLLKAYRALDRFEPGTNARSWLLTILRNAWVDRVRSVGASKENTSIDDVVGELAGPMETAEEQGWDKPEELLGRFGDQEIIGALQLLPDEIRWTLLLVDVEGMEHEEAARILEVPVGTIKSRAHRGRKMLREALLPRAKELGFISRGQDSRGRTEVAS